MSSDLPTHAELARSLAASGLGVNASDLHGSLSGFLCVGGHADPGDWLNALQLDGEAPAPACAAILGQLYRSCRAQFGNSCVDVVPLLPGDDAPLARRAAALAEWCRGFLGGCGLAGTLEAQGLSEDTVGILADLGAIAATHCDTLGGDEDERAFIGLVEFVATAAALLHRESCTGWRGQRRLH
ncbi:UPF0149 family protein [Dokdonella sp.]|uniref:UPF0149 family protein n=1 Tax=Dokdonella sp. TaxID=2291710 RepID=UPI0031C0C0B3|nr:UPF0149 family protein [Dokdonella sp.]